jgi:hypothetical protein
MTKYEGLSVILACILAGGTIVTLIMSFVPFPWKYPLLFVSIVIFLIFILWYFYYYLRRHGEQTGARLETSILPFYRGSFTPPSSGVKTVNPDGSITYSAKNDIQATGDQVHNLASSQIFAMWQGKPGENMNEFIAKFGVIRFKAIKGYVKGCRVGAKYRVIEEMNVSRVSKWYDGGYLNWFSPKIKQDLRKCNLFERIYNGINECLRNETTDIFQDEEKDLLLFYIIKGSPKVHLCSTLDYCEIGIATAENMPLKFELKLTIVGENLLTMVKTLKISAVWDDFKIEEMDQ